MDWRRVYEKRKFSAKKALTVVRRGQRVFVGSACAEPRGLVSALLDRADELHDVEILHFVNLGEAPYLDMRYQRRFRHNAFFVGPASRQSVNDGRSDYTPVFMHQVPALFAQGKVPLDVALIQVSPPDDHGYVSLGIGVDVVRAAAEHSRVVIAQVNVNMPRTLGNSFLRVDAIDMFVERDEPLLEFTYPEPGEVTDAIAKNAARLIEDRDCLHIGYGQTPYHVLRHLGDRRDLGMHTEVVSDAVRDLIEAGVITGKYKTYLPGRVVCSFAIGSAGMYRYVNLNPNFLFLPSQQVYDPMIIAQNPNVVSIGSALEVDISGQVSSESLGFSFYSGIGGRLDFMRGAAMSKGGKPIVVLPSTNKAGDKSRIVHRLSAGAGVVATRGDVHYIVTEYGIADLHGRTMRERAMALINIAHPKFRDELLAQAKEHAYVYPDQILLHAEQNLYPKWAEAEEKMRDGTPITIRPIQPTDEVAVQKFFYSHSEETVYNRYFRPVRALPHVTAQGLVNLDYDEDMALVATTGHIGREEIVGIGRYVRDSEGDLAEVAYTVHDQYQGQGLGSILQDHLTAYARRKGVGGFWAVSFGSNKAMLKVFGKLGEYSKKVIEPGVWRVAVRFGEPPGGEAEGQDQSGPEGGGGEDGSADLS